MMIIQHMFRLIPIAAIQISLFLFFSAAINSPPVFGAAAGTGTLSWSANNEPDLAGYEIFFGDQSGVYNHPNSPISVGKVSSYNFPPGMLAPGVTYYFALTAKDLANNTSGLSTEISGALPADTTPPTVSITTPANGSTVSGTVVVSATASDISGIEQVQFFLDGNPLGNPDTSVPFEITWNTTDMLGHHTLSAQARDNTGMETISSGNTITVVDAPVVAWKATDQNPGGSWEDSGWANRSFRVLLDGSAITSSGSTIQLTLRGRSSGNYTIQRVSLVRRDGNSLDGIDSSFRQVTFGGTWDDGTMVPAGGTITSDPIPFDLIAGQDIFLSYWVPTGNPTLWYQGGSINNSDSSWIITGTDTSATIDWEGLSISNIVNLIYSAEMIEVLETGGSIPQTLTVTVTGNGTVSSDIGNISCPGTCQDSFTQDAVVTLTAQAAAGSRFSGWEGGNCTGTTPCVLPMNQAYAVLANFENDSPPPDTTPPTVDIPTPAQGEVVAGVVTISATANDNIGVEAVRFLVNNVQVGGEDTTSPYSTNWDTTALLPNSYDLKAIARDAAGNETTSATITVSVAQPIVDNNFPTVNLTAPAPNAEVFGLVTINASASDNVGVVGVRFLVDNVQVGTEDMVAPYSMQWDTTTLPSGPYELTAIARDAGGNETTSDVIPVTLIDPPVGSVNITNLSVTSGKAYLIKVDGLQDGEKVYIDRSYNFSNVPSAINGATFIQTANTDKNSTGNSFLNFTVDQPVTVYVGHDARVTLKPSWLNSFTNTGMNLVTSDTTLTLFSQSFPAGPITLGGNEGGGKSMYSVAVISDGPPVSDTTPPTVSLIAPAEGDNVFGVVNLQATAADNVGVVGVRFLVEDVQIGIEDMTGPYSTLWDTTPLIPGTFTLKAIARDDAGNETTSEAITITLIEPPTTPFTITNVSVESGKLYEVQIENLQNGERVYIDRSYTFKNIPGALAGSTYIKTANNDKNSSGNSFLTFTVDQPVTVYVAYDARLTSKPSWLNSFTDTGMSLVSSDTTLDLYSKPFPAGPVILGGNQGSKKSMYSVVVTGP